MELEEDLVLGLLFELSGDRINRIILQKIDDFSDQDCEYRYSTCTVHVHRTCTTPCRNLSELSSHILGIAKLSSHVLRIEIAIHKT